MINLVPDNIKLNSLYSRRNTRLIRYALIASGTVILVFIMGAISIISMMQTQNNLNKEIDDQQSKLDSLKQIEAEGQKLSDQINTINELLDRQISFSTLLPDIAKILPPGAILKQLDFKASDITGDTSSAGRAVGSPNTTKTLDKPFVIFALVTDRSVAATLLENIKARGDLFSRAELIDVIYNTAPSSAQAQSSSGSQTLLQKYPYQVTINAYFKKKSKSKTASTLQATPIVQLNNKGLGQAI